MVESLHKVLLMGYPGAGKTHATHLLAGVPHKRVFHLLLEPTSLSVLKKSWMATFGKIPDNVGWHQFEYPADNLAELEAIAKSVTTLPGDALHGWKSPFKAKHDELSRMISFLRDVKDDRTGTSWGSANTWDNDTILVIDSLTALCDLAWSQCYGGRLAIEPSEYAVSQKYLELFFKSVCHGWNCHAIVTAHVEERSKSKQAENDKDKDVRLYPSIIGGKLRNTFGGLFTEVVLATKLGSNWTWNTQSMQADVKQRVLPLSASIPPDFRKLFEAGVALDKTSVQ